MFYWLINDNDDASGTGILRKETTSFCQYNISYLPAHVSRFYFQVFVSSLFL